MAPSPPPRALVLGDDLGVYLAVVRSLGRRGIEVHLVPADDDSPGLFSRYVSAVHELPAYRTGPEAWVAALRELIDRHDFRLIFPCSDSDLTLLARHADQIGRARLALPNPEAAAAFTDKAQTRALAARLGVPVAQGRVLDCAGDPVALVAKLGLPLVLKPCRSYRAGAAALKERAVIVRTPEGLERELGACRPGEWLAESFFEGDSVGLSVVASRGRILLAAQHRRRHTVSETGGSSVRSTEAVDPRLLAHVRSLAQAVNLTGPAMFEFRRRGDSHILLEVNARFWGSLPLAVAAGADFPALAWDVFTGHAPAPKPGYRVGLERTNLGGEIDRRSALMEEASGSWAKLSGLTQTLAFLLTLSRPSRFDSWAADDPRPYRVERRAVLRRIAHRLLKRLPRRQAAPAVTRPAT